MCCGGKSLVSGVTTARDAPTVSNSSFGAWRAHSSAVQNGYQPPPKKTQDEGSVAAQLLGAVETAVGVCQEEIWRGVSELQCVRFHVCIAQPAHEAAV